MDKMEITKSFIQYADYQLIGYLIVEDGNYWAIDINKNLIYNDKPIAKLSEELTLEFPFFCRFGKSEFLLIEGGGTEKMPNAWILTEKGEIKERFFVGENPHKVHVQHEKIIIAYSFYEQKVGLRIFDRNGKMLSEFGRDTELGVGHEVKAICKKNENEIFIQCFIPHKISKINIETYEITNYKHYFEEFFNVLTYKEGFLYAGYEDNERYFQKEFDFEANTIDIYKFKISDIDKTLIEKEYLGKVPSLPYQVQSLSCGYLLFTDIYGYKVRSYWLANLDV
jgi:hypothetical protein